MTKEELLKNIETCGYNRCSECTLNKATGTLCFNELLTAVSNIIQEQTETIKDWEHRYTTLKNEMIKAGIIMQSRVEES